MADSEFISLRQFSLIVGVTQAAISKAIKDGRFGDCVLFDDDGRVKSVHAIKGKDEWFRNNPRPVREAFASRIPPSGFDEGFSPPSPVNGSFDYSIERAAREHYLAEIAKLDYEKLSGTLVEATVVETAWIKLSSTIKVRMLGIPTKVKNLLPHLTLDDIAVLDREIREGLEELSNPEEDSDED